jgi:NADP-dependent alcohol dehydrogenase
VDLIRFVVIELNTNDNSLIKMENFIFHNPVKIVFGKGEIAKLKELIPANTKIMLTYGGGSIKKNGVYDQVKNAIEGIDIIEFSGIEPNPRYEISLKRRR